MASIPTRRGRGRRPSRSRRTRPRPRRRWRGWWSRRARCRRCRRRRRRRLMPAVERRRPRTASARPGTETVTVSKKASWHDLDAGAGAGRRPGSPVSRCTRGRCGVSPSGPWYTAYIDGDHGQQHLGGADVGGGLLAADVLLAGLQGEAVGGAAGGVDRHADQPAGQRALVGVAGGQEAGVGPAEAERHAEALGRADHDVGARSRRAAAAGRGRAGRRPRRRGRRRSWAAAITAAWSRTAPLEPGYCSSTPKQPRRAGRRSGRRPTTSMPSGSARVRTTSMVWGWQSASTKNASRPALATSRRAHGHGLGRGGALVEQRGVGEVHAGEVGDHRLEVEQRLEPALGDLGLVRRVGRVPGRVLQHVAQDDAGGDGVRVAHADQRGQHLVAAGQGAQLGERLGLAAGRRGRSSGSSSRIDAGTTPVDQRRRATSSPSVASIVAWSSASGPMWRVGERVVASSSAVHGASVASGGHPGASRDRRAVPPLSRDLRASPAGRGPTGFPFGEPAREPPAFQSCLARAVRGA